MASALRNGELKIPGRSIKLSPSKSSLAKEIPGSGKHSHFGTFHAYFGGESALATYLTICGDGIMQRCRDGWMTMTMILDVRYASTGLLMDYRWLNAHIVHTGWPTLHHCELLVSSTKLLPNPGNYSSANGRLITIHQGHHQPRIERPITSKSRTYQAVSPPANTSSKKGYPRQPLAGCSEPHLPGATTANVSGGP